MTQNLPTESSAITISEVERAFEIRELAHTVSSFAVTSEAAHKGLDLLLSLLPNVEHLIDKIQQ